MPLSSKCTFNFIFNTVWINRNIFACHDITHSFQREVSNIWRDWTRSWI